MPFCLATSSQLLFKFLYHPAYYRPLVFCLAFSIGLKYAFGTDLACYFISLHKVFPAFSTFVFEGLSTLTISTIVMEYVCLHYISSCVLSIFLYFPNLSIAPQLILVWHGLHKWSIGMSSRILIIQWYLYILITFSCPSLSTELKKYIIYLWNHFSQTLFHRPFHGNSF